MTSQLPELVRGFSVHPIGVDSQPDGKVAGACVLLWSLSSSCHWSFDGVLVLLVQFCDVDDRDVNGYLFLFAFVLGRHLV